ncbi:MAG: hypothetical protein V7767_00725 [Leeuwenhoekiella sp.]
MLVLRILVFAILMGSGVLHAAPVRTISIPESCSHKIVKSNSFSSNKGALLLVAKLNAESVFLQHTVPKPTLDYTSYNGRNTSSIDERIKVSLIYLRCGDNIDLKLASHSIPYPFHAFP